MTIESSLLLNLMYIFGSLFIVVGGALANIRKLNLRFLGIFICAAGGVIVYLALRSEASDVPSWIATAMAVVVVLLIFLSIAMGGKPEKTGKENNERS